MKAHNGGYLKAYHHNAILAALGGYAWPGGYPVALVMIDGELLCSECVRENVKLIVRATHDNGRSGWQAIGADVYWELEDDEVRTCAHCNNPIELAHS